MVKSFLLERANTQRPYVWCGLKFQCGLCNEIYDETVRHWQLHPASKLFFTNNKVNPKDNFTKDHSLLYNDTPSLENSSVLVLEDIKFRFEIKKNLFIKRDKLRL